MPLTAHVLHSTDARRGYLAQLCVTDDALFAVGGTSNSVTVLASSDARHFHGRGLPSHGIRGGLVRGDEVIVVGEYGLVARSSDEGETWEVVDHDSSSCLFSIVEVDGTIWMAGDGGTLLRWDTDAPTAVDSGTSERISCVASTTDATWLLHFDGALRRLGDDTEVLRGPRALTDLVQTPRGTLIVTGDGGQVHRSTDGGASFTAVTTGVAEDLEAVGCMADGRVVIVGGGATVQVSDDDGQTFTPVDTDLSGGVGLWSVTAFGTGVVVGGDEGLVLYLGDTPPWEDREDRFHEDKPLDEVFVDGPEGFLEARLRTFVEVRNPQLTAPPMETSEPQEPDEPEVDEDEDDDDEEEHDPDDQGADAWRKGAWELARTLWSGTTDDYEAVWGTAPPPELVALERGTAGANPWTTFEELRLDAQLMAEPPPDENLFEKIILSDQLNYLGTAMPEVFAGVTCFGSLGNGDTYHYEVYGDERQRTVQFWDHETHRFDYTFTNSLESLVYLSALCAAADDEQVSDEVAAAGYAALRGRVAPSWHFSMDERDPDFEEYEHPDGAEFARFLFWRAAWIISFFRQDGIVEVTDLGDRFIESLNGVLPDEHFPARLDAARKYVPTALYALWRAWLFDEPELGALLEVTRAHSARIVRDAAKLVDELRAGRTHLGKITDMPRLVERFRELDLDPRRADERAAEEAERQRVADLRRDELLATFDALSTADAEAFLWEHVQQREARPGLLARVLAHDDRAEVRRALTFLAEEGYSRNNCLYRDEEHEACAWVAHHADPAVQALLVGQALYPTIDEQEGVAISSHHAWEALKRLAGAGRLDARALPELRRVVEAANLEEDDPGWFLSRVVEVLGLARDEGSVSSLAALLEGIPDEGGFETSLKYDDFVEGVADALARIGSPDGAACLVRFAATPALRMRDARTGSARAVARLAPELGTEAMLLNLVELTTKINSSEENSASLLAVGRMGQTLDAEARARVLEAVRTTEPMSKSYVEVQLARAVAVHLLGGDAEVEALLDACLTQPGWKEEYTVRRRRFALEVLDVVPLADPSLLLPLLDHRDEALTAETLVILERLGHPADLPRTLTWFDAEAMTDNELVVALADDALGGRQHAARHLAARGEVGRSALEAAALAVMDRAPSEPGADLAQADERIHREAVRGLLAMSEASSTLAVFDALLRHPNRDVKDPVLRNAPAAPELADAMRRVAAEKYGWQESNAREWLEAHAG